MSLDIHIEQIKMPVVILTSGSLSPTHCLFLLCTCTNTVHPDNLVLMTGRQSIISHIMEANYVNKTKYAVDNFSSF